MARRILTVIAAIMVALGAATAVSAESPPHDGGPGDFQQCQQDCGPGPGEGPGEEKNPDPDPDDSDGGPKCQYLWGHDGNWYYSCEEDPGNGGGNGGGGNGGGGNGGGGNGGGGNGGGGNGGANPGGGGKTYGGDVVVANPTFTG